MPYNGRECVEPLPSKDEGFMARTDAALIEACLAGDRQAWDELVLRYDRLVMSIPRHFGLTMSEADDVAQNVFMALLNGLEQLRDPDRLSSWLITVARRQTWRYVMKRRREIPLEEADVADSAASRISPLAPDAIQLWERQHLVRQGLRNLNTRCRRLLELLFFAATEPSYVDIAELLTIPVGSIGPTRARCLEKLRRILES